ncbi:M48 family metallopeptidase [Candidatus Woesearchaeota archaeon]|nr:M48 family metallopeptidase [Candidatus Woesearchaeota archaeon]
MDIIQESFAQLYPEKALQHQYLVKYSGRFKDFNAQVRYTPQRLEFRLSRKWRPISKDIQIGLIQELLNKVFRTNVRTTNIDVYNIFIKKLHLVAPKTKSDPLLSASFRRLNGQFFADLLEEPNMVWGNGIRKLGSYEYQTDTITIAESLRGSQELLDYVMHHEMLHKQLKFSSNGRRACHHNAEFKRRERAYPHAQQLERQLQSVVRRRRWMRMLVG